MRSRHLAALALAGVLGAGAVIPALAQDPSPAPTEGTQDQATTKAERRAAREQAFAEALAEELGLPVEQVTEALQNVREQMRAQAREQALARLEERLDAAVEAGQLTQEQADAILEAARNGVLPLRPRGHRGFHGAPAGADGGASTAPAVDSTV